jgi:hypothetical protein
MMFSSKLLIVVHGHLLKPPFLIADPGREQSWPMVELQVEQGLISSALLPEQWNCNLCANRKNLNNLRVSGYMDIIEKTEDCFRGSQYEK